MKSIRKVDVDLLKTMPLPDWNDNTSKASRGKLLLVGGSRHLPGRIKIWIIGTRFIFLRSRKNANVNATVFCSFSS